MGAYIHAQEDFLLARPVIEKRYFMAQEAVVCVDILGGDNAPDPIMQGALDALVLDKDLRLVVVGPQELVEELAARHNRIEAVIATQEITMDDKPEKAVIKKKDSSIVRGCQLVAQGKAQAFFSAGSTSACYLASVVHMGRISRGVRVPLCALIPSPVSPLLMCDVGANAQVELEDYLHFARMGSIYAQKLFKIEHPRVGLLNIGSEECKGTVLLQQAYRQLSNAEDLNFCGNVEGNKILTGACDVLVCDGFTGNIALKTLEGTAKTVFSTIKGVCKASIKNKLGALLLKKDLKQLAGTLNPDAHGGALLLGLKGVSVIGHGSSSARAVTNGILLAARMVRSSMVQEIEQALCGQETSDSLTSGAQSSCKADEVV